MICPNCGRRNSAGATFCSRCHQRLPLANKLNGNQRRVVMVEPRGGGGSGAIVLGVALLAGFLFIGGAAAIYLSNPPATADPTNIAYASGSPTLPPFVQPTATQSPTPTPTFILLPSDSPASFSPLPTDTTGFPTPQPTPPPTGGPPTAPPPPTVQGVVVRFACSQRNTTLTMDCRDNSIGPVASREWSFGDGSPTSNEANPSHIYIAYRTYTVSLVITGSDGKQYFKNKDITLRPPATPAPTSTGTVTPPPTPPPSPTAEPTETAGPTPTPSPTPSPAPTASSSVAVQPTDTPNPDPTVTPAP